jgi:hypothetical protein
MGPTPFALTMDQTKNAIPAMGTTIAFAVNKWRLYWVYQFVMVGVKGGFAYILWIGNQIAGSEINQKRKKHMKSRVFVPEDSGIEFAENSIE